MIAALAMYFILRDLAETGRAIAMRPEREEGLVKIAPGAPPMLAFRYLDGRKRGRFGGLDLVLDDAGH